MLQALSTPGQSRIEDSLNNTNADLPGAQSVKSTT